jgi:mannitol/fructose-specific phosphotransferase system IIA component (Ntr-type)
MKNGYVKDEFFQAVMQREEMGETCFKEVAFPHTWPEAVNKPIIGVCILQSPISWSEGHDVGIVFVLALQIADSDIVGKIYEVGASAELYNRLRNAESKAEVIRLLTEQ